MYFSIKDDKLLTKYDDMWNKVCHFIGKEFDSKPIYNKKFLKNKVRSYGDEATDFHDEEMPKIGSNYVSLWVIIIDFVLKKDKNYYPLVFLEECKYIEK